jgi:para-nitrobenzyl esterase
VAVLLHGSWSQGHAGGAAHDARVWANRTGAVVVVPNFRLGLVGFGAFWMRNGTTVLGGNYGLRDQSAALRWVAHNAGAFGGDPNRVTLVGHGSGAQAVAIHLAYPGSRGLFHQAALASPPLGAPLRNRESWSAVMLSAAQLLNCTTVLANGTNNITEPAVGCLQRASPDALLDAQDSVARDVLLDAGAPLQAGDPFLPVFGQYDDLSRVPLSSLTEGLYEQMPLLVGFTAQEARLFVRQTLPRPLPIESYSLLAGFVVPWRGGAVAARYACANRTDCRVPLEEASDDALFYCPGRAALDDMSDGAAQAGNLYAYVFDHAPSAPAAVWGNRTYCYNASCFGADVPYAFQPPGAGASWSAGERALAGRMLARWSAFVHTGSPNEVGGPSPAWPPYNATARATLRLGVPLDAVAAPAHSASCDWWDAQGYAYTTDS